MNISSIRESGSNNLLKWAIKNNADLRNNTPLASLINDELFFLINIDDVNLYEVYRLTQLYRNKLRVLTVNSNKMPPDAQLNEIFLPENTDLVKETIDHFISLTAQMVSDSDIIEEGFPKLFIPMITSTFNIQIPLSFIDILEVLSEDECNKLFSADYPLTLNSITNEDEYVMLKSAIYISVERNTQDIKYNNKYEKLLNVTKYFPLKIDNKQIYKCGLVGFSKFDNIARSQVKCNLFNADKDDIDSKMKQMSRIKTPLELEFAIQLPIYYMNILEASYYPEDLIITYRSSMANIISNGMVFNNFKFNEDDPESSETEITAYRVRISEANHKLLQTLEKLIKINETNRGIFDTTANGIFTLLPPVYLTNAIITIDYENIPQFTNSSDNVISSLFKNIENIANGINDEIQYTR